MGTARRTDAELVVWFDVSDVSGIDIDGVRPTRVKLTFDGITREWRSADIDGHQIRKDGSTGKTPGYVYVASWWRDVKPAWLVELVTTALDTEWVSPLPIEATQ